MTAWPLPRTIDDSRRFGNPVAIIEPSECDNYFAQVGYVRQNVKALTAHSFIDGRGKRIIFLADV